MGNREGFAPSVVVTGGAGFLGSHLCERLVGEGHVVACLDDLSTGRTENIAALQDSHGFRFVEADLTGDETPAAFAGWRPRYVIHLASPASPDDYLRMPLRTLRCGSIGTERALELAASAEARFLLASTSEVYGDPLVHPQPESYWGNVNPVGVRSVYDEAKRFAEALTMAYHRELRVDVGIARFFNTYGPRMRIDDGRLVPQLITEALAGQPLTINGDGEQTRSLCYVDDLIDGILLLLDSQVTGPVNLGNPDEYSVKEIAAIIADVTGTDTGLNFTPARADDPVRRKPDISYAQASLGWQPRTSVRDGIARTMNWYQTQAAPAAVSAL